MHDNCGCALIYDNYFIGFKCASKFQNIIYIYHKSYIFEKLLGSIALFSLRPTGTQPRGWSLHCFTKSLCGSLSSQPIPDGHSGITGSCGRNVRGHGRVCKHVLPDDFKLQGSKDCQLPTKQETPCNVTITSKFGDIKPLGSLPLNRPPLTARQMERYLQSKKNLKLGQDLNLNLNVTALCNCHFRFSRSLPSSSQFEFQWIDYGYMFQRNPTKLFQKGRENWSWAFLNWCWWCFCWWRCWWCWCLPSLVVLVLAVCS